MLKVDKETLDWMEDKYPGIVKSILRFDEALLPACSRCESKDTANVQCGVIGRTINIAAATTKLKLIANGPKEGKYFCNTCDKFFGEVGGEPAGGGTVPIQTLMDIGVVTELYRNVSGNEPTSEN